MNQSVARPGAALVLFSLACGDPGSPDTEAPSIAFVSPRTEFVMETVTIAADAHDDRGVAGVRFRLNGADLGPEDQTEPYMMSWNTLDYANGQYTLTATARDLAGNQTTVGPVIVTVVNAP
jgi:hypothetical protein